MVTVSEGVMDVRSVRWNANPANPIGRCCLVSLSNMMFSLCL